ncbi:MAG: hypothetical protein GXZ13_07465 [Synergistaceae bacterium]|nr:hypothetical protein [Synergistaceae bacterium]
MEEFNLDIDCVDFTGEASGPSIVFTGAIHGDEQTGTHTAHLLIQALKKEKILGNIRIMPICNPSAFKARRRPAVEDDEDLNRIFPGKKDGTYSQQLAHRIWELTEDYEYIVDLHCCGIYGSEYTMCWYSKYDFHPKLARWLGYKSVVHTAGTGGQFYLESCEKRGQKGLLIELPGGQPRGVINQESAVSSCEKLLNYLKLIGVIEGRGVLPEEPNYCGFIDPDAALAKEDGVYYPMVKPGDYIKKGESIARVDEEDYTAPFDALVTSAPISRYVFEGDRLVSLAPTRSVEPGEV